MYETKVILALLAEKIANAETIEEIYFAVQTAASVEGLKLPEYVDLKKQVNEKKKK